MLKKTNLLAFGFILLSFNLFGQDISEEKPKLKNEIAIDVSPILGGFIKQNGLPGLFYRRHFKNSALRAKVNFSIDKGNSDNSSNQSQDFNSSTPKTTKNNFAQIDYSLGIQTNKDISEKWKFYCGVDLFSGYSSNKSTTNTQIQGYNSGVGTYYYGVSNQEYSSKSIYGGISPFLGFTWQLNRKLGLSIEAAAPVGYYKTTSTWSRFTSGTDFNSESFSDNNSNFSNFRARLLPVSNLLISYHF